MNVAVVGGGPAGMTAAIAAAERGARVTLFEHNEKLGKKLYITGKGRCNFTNACDADGFFAAVVSNPKFLYSAFAAFDNTAVMAFFERNGVPYKIERGRRVFPRSDKSSDVIRALSGRLRELGVAVRLGAHAEAVTTADGHVTGITVSGKTEAFSRVVLACGGLGYPATGSDGSGYGLARALGHGIVSPRPALVPLLLSDDTGLEGLSLRNVRVSVRTRGKVLASEQGEMLFTAHGVSGPVVLTLSSLVGKRGFADCELVIDLKPALSAEQTDARVLRDFEAYSNRDFGNALGDLLPRSLIPYFVKRTGIPPTKKVNLVTASERNAVVSLLKELTFTIAGTEPIAHGIVTAGGVDVREVVPSTMESKLVRGLYFAGEMLDLDALTGGFNLQIAFSTGYLAGKSTEEAI